MNKPSEALTGAVVAVYIAGEAGGALTQTVVGDRLGRIRFMQIMVGLPLLTRPFGRQPTDHILHC